MEQRHEPVNVLGAVAMAAMDGIWAALAPEIGHGADAAALVAIGHTPGLSNDGLGHVLGLSHPGAVRLVDRLVAAGLIERARGADRRVVSLQMTPAGADRRAAMLARRQAVLERLLAPLENGERDTLARLLAKMLERLPRDWLHGLSICRLCNERRCLNCPVDAGVEHARAAQTASQQDGTSGQVSTASVSNRPAGRRRRGILPNAG